MSQHTTSLHDLVAIAKSQGRRIIGISGKKRSGKDTLAGILAKICPNSERIAFADSLKEEFCSIAGITLEQLEANKARYRLGLQLWGTDFRRSQDQNYWLKRFVEKVIASAKPTILVPDVRFQNEGDLVRELGGIVVRVERGQESEDTHVSEIAMDTYPHYRAKFFNTGTLEDFEADIKRAVNIFPSLKEAA